MTTKLIIEKLVRDGKLRRFEPYLREKETHKREVFMSDFLWRHINEKVTELYGIEYQVKLEQRLARFIKGDRINDFQDIKELKPFGSGVWEFKIIEEPQSRIFGAFVEYDVFIAFCMKKRDNVAGKDFNPSFENFGDYVINQWKILFKNKEKLLSSNIDKLISNGVSYDPRKKK